MARRKLTLIAGWLFVLTACSFPQTDVSPEGNLEILGSSTVIEDGLLSQDWVAEGLEQVPDPSMIVTALKSGAEATLVLRSDLRRYIVLRRTSANLLASPFFSWSWKVAAGGNVLPRIRMVFGFVGGNKNGPRSGRRHLFTAGTRVPVHDRSFAIIWGENELQRGSILHAPGVPRYVARGGRGGVGKWWTENINLAEIYRAMWPGDDLVNTRITFVGFASPTSDKPSEISFSDVNLFR